MLLLFIYLLLRIPPKTDIIKIFIQLLQAKIACHLVDSF